MPRWQYANLEVQSVFDQNKWQFVLSLTGPDGKVHTLQISDEVAALNWLGAYEWELVGISLRNAGLFFGKLDDGSQYQGAGPMRRQFWLKRPVSKE